MTRPVDWIIGVGASAGGLAALRAFVGAWPPGLNAAILVLQHRDPDHLSQLTALLGRSARPKVVEASDGLQLDADTIYVAPPAHYVDLEEGGVLRLSDPPEARYHRSPIDHAFSQIAERYGAQGIGVVLSGTGNDGAQGVREIQGAGGTVFVQTPDEAEFDGMPRAAIATGMTDHVGAADALPRTIAAVIRTAVAEDGSAPPGKDFDPVLRLLYDETGFDFSDYKTGTVSRRILRRMGIAQQISIAGYVACLRESPPERDLLLKDLMIGVTRFFRDPAAWDALGRQAIDPLLARLSDGDTIRVWSAGCSTGEEAYSLAILLLERIERSGKRIKPVIFASDLNSEAIDRARTGRYPASATVEIPDDRFDRFFERLDHDIRVRPHLRETLVFAVQNAVSDPPFSDLDLITCRNMMIYLETGAQTRLFETFHFSLRPGGVLMLGLSEGSERANPWFEPVELRVRLFRRTDIQRRAPARPAGRWDAKARTSVLGAQAGVAGADPVVQAMLKRFAPPTILVDGSLDVKRIHGDVRGILDFSSGMMTGNLVSLLAAPFQARTWSALNAAKASGETVETTVFPSIGEGLPTRVTVEPFPSRTGRQYLVYFVASPPPAEASDAPAPPEADFPTRDDDRHALDSLRLELQAVVEKAESSTEKLQAANEEVQSANEELQSSNEELEASREELQSLNEELSTINAELEEKVKQLEATNDDLANLIASTDIATIFLGTDMSIRRFSAKATELISIRDTDIGRPFAELHLRVDDPDLLADAAAVLDELESVEREISGEGHAYLRRIVPYRTRTNQIQGVVVTFADIHTLRETSERLAVQARRQACIADMGELALSAGALDALFERIVRDVAEHLDAPVVEVQLLMADKSAFRLVAGQGWPRGVAGHAMSPNDPGRHLGFTLGRQPVVEVAHIGRETRFAPTEILADRSVTCGVCLSIGTLQAPVGVLAAWREGECNFDPGERDFLRAVAKILWLAINHAETQRKAKHESDALQDLIDGLPVMVALVDSEFRFRMSNRTFERMGLVMDEMRGATVEGVFGAATMEALAEATHQSGETAVQFETELSIPGEGKRTFLMHCAPRDVGGQLEGYYIAAIDIDARKRGELRNRVISAELDHRVKNILGLVNAIAGMTERSTSTVREFRAVFSDRIHALSRAHAGLAEANWDGMDLERLLRTELEAFASDKIDRFTLRGAPVRVGPTATQSLALAFHELATNAAKYGALSGASGRVAVDWEVDDLSLTLDWVETGVTSLCAPEEGGFGTSVIRTAVQGQLEGEMSFAFEPTGLVFRMSVPTDTLTAMPEPL